MQEKYLGILKTLQKARANKGKKRIAPCYPLKMNLNLPSISIVIPTYNEEKKIAICLKSIFQQDYPKKLLEVIIVDNYSIDKTVDLAREFKVKVYYNEIRDPEISKMIGLKKSQNEFFMYLDADIELVGRDWFRRIITPLVENSNIVGAFPRFIPKRSSSAIARFLRYHPLDLDPVLQFFCKEIRNTILLDRGDYFVCRFNPDDLPPIGICIYRRKTLERLIGHMGRFMDIDVPAILSDNGYDLFAYVPSSGIYHNSIMSLKELLLKRGRNIDQVYLPNLENRCFTYFNMSAFSDVIKIIFWIIYTNMFFPKLLKGIFNSIKFKDMACLYESPVSIILTDYLFYKFLKNERGRTMIKKRFREMLLGH